MFVASIYLLFFSVDFNSEHYKLLDLEGAIYFLLIKRHFKTKIGTNPKAGIKTVDDIKRYYVKT
jgi:hypothetical protein